VFDTLPWPQFESSSRRESAQISSGDSTPSRSPKSQSELTSAAAIAKIDTVASAAVALRALRHEIMRANGWSLRELYKSLETPGENRLRDAHAALDTAVRAAYGMKPGEDILAFLLKLNLELADKEAKGESITPPGLPENYPDAKNW
jgi:hypothetical protein